MEPSIISRFQHAGDRAIESIAVICRDARTPNFEEYIDNWGHAVLSSKVLQRI
jgi:hypothetical protein